MSSMLCHIALKYFGQIWKSHRNLFNLNAKRYTIFVSIYHHFLLSIISTKLYLYLICGKGMKSISGVTRHLNACKGHLYPTSQPPHKSPQHKSHNKEDTLGRNWEDEDDLLGKTVIITTANSITGTPTEDTPRKELFTNESLSALREE